MPDESPMVLAEHEMRRPAGDTRKYRVIELRNGLEAVLVSDLQEQGWNGTGGGGERTTAAVAMNVSAGNLQDPPEWRGLAHLLEHMLLQGSSKYPGASDFKAFVASAAGRSNAHTGLDNTNYHFSCAAHRLEEGLDRFASLFVAPLLNEENVIKEINVTTQLLQAVDSEHNKNIYEDSRREFQLLRSTTCEGQPLRQYGSGNMFTLSHAAHASEVARVNRPRHFESHLDLPGEVPVAAPEGAAHEGDDNSQPGRGSVAEQLRRFWEDNYSSHIMKLAIVAPLTLDQLQEWVAKYFSDVPRRSIRPMQGVEQRWGAGGCLGAFADDWYKCYRIVPVKESRSIKLFFPLPPVVGGETQRDDPKARWRAKRERLLSFCIGHEGRGSILSLLKSRGWATGLSAGTSFTTRFVAIFKIDVNLTPAGLAKHQEVVAAIILYISGCLRHDSMEGERQRVYSEMRQAKEMRFTHMDRVNPESYVQALSRNLEHYPPDMLLDGPELFHEPQVDLDALDCLLDKYFLERYRVHLVAPEGEFSGDEEADIEEDKATGSEWGQSTNGWCYERWYGAQYRRLELRGAGDSEQCFLNELSLPEANKYLPDSLSLTVLQDECCQPSSEGGVGVKREGVPKLLRVMMTADDGVEEPVDRMVVWHLSDVSFGTPKAFVAVHLSSWEGNESAEDSAARRMMINILEDVTNEEVYEAGEAGLSAKIGDRHGSPYPGVRLAVKGYSNKLGRLLLWLCQRLVSLDVTNMPDTYQRVQRRTVQNLSNHRHDKAYEHCAALRSAALVQPSYQWKEKADAVEACTPAFLQNFISRFMSQATLRVLMVGDITPQSASELSVQLASILGVAAEGDLAGLQARFRTRVEGGSVESLDIQEQLGKDLDEQLSQERIPQVLRMADGDERRVTVAHPDGGKSADSAVDIYLECGDSNTANNVMVEVVALVVDKPFFAQLRTTEQLGYIVGAGVATNHAAAALVFRVQSVKPPTELEARIDAFLCSFRDVLQELTTERLEQLKTSLCMRKREPDKSIESRGLRLMSEVCAASSQGTFYRKAREIEALERICVEDVKSFYDKFLMPSSSARRRLVCSLVGGAALSTMDADSPELLSLRASVPPEGPMVDVSVATPTPNLEVEPPAVTKIDPASPTSSSGRGGQRVPAQPDAGPAADDDSWPTFGVARSGSANRAASRGGGRGRRPRFMKFAQGDGCGDPNCGGMC